MLYLPKEEVVSKVRGYKATLKNSNVSKEAKRHAKEQLELLERQYGTDSKSSKDTDDKDLGSVARGLKAALKNPNAREEKKREEKKREVEEKLEQIED